KALVSYRGKTFQEKRLHSLVCLCIDTGARIDELLQLKKSAIDFDNLLIKVTGKGSKDRLIPISRECRAVLFRWCRHEFDYVFPAKGHRWAYRSALDQFKRLCSKLGVEGTRNSFHLFRHGFATNWMKQGGSLYTLSRVLG